MLSHIVHAQALLRLESLRPCNNRACLPTYVVSSYGITQVHVQWLLHNVLPATVLVHDLYHSYVSQWREPMVEASA